MSNQIKASLWTISLTTTVGIFLGLGFWYVSIVLLLLHLYLLNFIGVSFSDKQTCECVVFFDGVCGLCNRFVDIVLKLDIHGRFLFSPLQGTSAKDSIPESRLEELDTIFYKEGDRLYEKSTAVIRILIRLGGVGLIGGLLFVFPMVIRDWIYDWVAKSRYKVFGKKKNCRIVSPQEKSRFLD